MMLRHLVIVIIVAAAFAAAFSHVGARGLPPQSVIQATRLSEASNRLSLANLLTGLFLTKEQLSELAEISEQADKLRLKHLNSATETMAKARQSYEELVSHVLKAEAASPVIDKPDEKARQKAVDYEHKLKKLKANFNKELLALQQQATSALTPAQLRVIATFSPCIVPPKSLTDPVRVGQAQGTETVERIVDLLRRAPQKLYDKEVKRIVDLALKQFEKKGALRPVARQAWKREMLAHLTRIRAMDDVEYALEGAQKAQDLLLYDESKESSYMDRWQPNNVGRYLLCQGAATVFKGFSGGTKPSSVENSKASIDPRIKKSLSEWGNAAKPMAEALKKMGKLPPWVEGEKRNIEKLMKKKEHAQALTRLKNACNRLAQISPIETTLVWHRCRVAEKVRQRGLEAVFTNNKLNLFGLPALAERAKKELKQGKKKQVIATIKEIETLVEEFRAIE